VVLLLWAANTAFASSPFRCGNNLAQIGDHSFKVSQNCGEPILKEVVGYTLTEGRRRELKIENWIYGPEGGVYYILVFEGGILAKILSFHD
jgi:hypothetical protein